MKAIYFFDEGENTLFDEAFPSRGITVTPYEGKFAPFVKGNLFKAPSKGYYTFLSGVGSGQALISYFRSKKC